MEKMICGSCGKSKHKLFRNDVGIIAKCVNCKSESIITIKNPKLIIDNYKGDGTICVFK